MNQKVVRVIMGHKMQVFIEKRLKRESVHEKSRFQWACLECLVKKRQE